MPTRTTIPPRADKTKHRVTFIKAEVEQALTEFAIRRGGPLPLGTSKITLLSLRGTETAALEITEV